MAWRGAGVGCVWSGPHTKSLRTQKSRKGAGRLVPLDVCMCPCVPVSSVCICVQLLACVSVCQCPHVYLCVSTCLHKCVSLCVRVCAICMCAAFVFICVQSALPTQALVPGPKQPTGECPEGER